MALLAVLWTMSLVALVAAGFGGRTRTKAVVARNLVDAAEAEAVADAGIRLAALGSLGAEPPIDIDSASSFTVGRGVALVQIQDEAGKLDLNTADPELLERLFRVTGMDASTARKLRHGIEDRQELQQPAFTMVDQLVAMAELPPPLFARLKASLTIFSGELTANATVAGADVRAALEQGPRPGPSPLDDPAATVQDDGEPVETGNVFSIRSTGRLANGTTFVREAVVARSRRIDIPIRILSWQRGRRAAAD